MTAIGDQELVARLRAGEDAAYEIVVREHTSRLLSVTLRLLKDREEARDAVQETFLSAFRAIDKFEGGAAVGTWLHRIAVNCALMRIRSRRAKPEQPIEDLLPTFDETGHREGASSAPWEDDGHARLESQERDALVRRCIDQLPDSYRTVLLLRDIEELDTLETATLLGITENAVKIRLHRARQALRGLLDPYFGKGVPK